MLYLILKWLHVLSAITAVGSNLTYAIWLTRADRQPDALPFTLRGVKLIDDRMANPAYGLLLITGLSMAFVGRIALTTPWLLTALILFVGVILLGMFGYTPTLRRQIALLDEAGAGSAAYQAMARRGLMLGRILALLVVIIVFMMVVKPPLWG